jgi:nucleoid-associated protein YgaU
MTSDAKVGLLLSLVFIFIIAFVINGLPNYFRKTDSNDLTRDYLNKLRSYDSDITHGAREAVEAMSAVRPVGKIEISGGRRYEDNSVRFTQSLPKIVPITGDDAAAKSAVLPLPADNRPKEAQVTYTAKLAGPKIYTVQDGDNLSLIAEKFYGPQEGCKRENVEMLFRANKNKLSSPDFLQVGQRLLIPPLKRLREGSVQASATYEQGLFEKAEDLESSTMSLASTVMAKAGRSRDYVVKEGDSLWLIAKEQLGNSGRYVEIVSLNKDIIEDEEQLDVGMRIKLPGR